MKFIRFALALLPLFALTFSTQAFEDEKGWVSPVSYTHLTLPTIYSV